jgi:hypothetical protein
MRTTQSLIVLALLAPLSAQCSEPGRAAAPPAVRPEPRVTATPVAQPEGAAAPTPHQFGQPIEPSVATVRLADLVATPSQYAARPIRVQGEVVAVCQEMGCWMEIRDNVTQAHIRMHGHSFFVPRDLRGHHAAVEATVVATHPPTDCDNEARAATGQAPQVELDATGVEVLD